MIIISSSIPKSASTLVFNYQQDLLALASDDNVIAQEKFKKYSYQGFSARIDLKTFFAAILTTIKYGDIVIKTHSEPTFLIKLLINLGLAKASFCYRDPRDIILSAIDHGERTRKGLDASGAYGNMTSIEGSIPEVKSWTSTWYKWKKFGKVFFIRYEDLVENQLLYILKINEYFDLKCEKEHIESIHIKHEKMKNKAWNFNKGVSERYKHEMKNSDLLLCNQEFQDILKDMNYSL